MMKNQQLPFGHNWTPGATCVFSWKAKTMKGAIVGDIIGSRFEWDNLKSKEFTLLLDDCHFTDDSVLTIAVAEAILTDQPYEVPVRAFARRYPDTGYGGSFFD